MMSLQLQLQLAVLVCMCASMGADAFNCTAETMTTCALAKANCNVTNELYDPSLFQCHNTFYACSECSTGAISPDACQQLPVDLDAAEAYAVLAGSAITNSGSTTRIIGDIGVSPGSSITGLEVGGVMYTGSRDEANPASAAGIASLTTAYNSAAGRVLCPVSKIGDLGGQTLGPGLYKSTSGLEITVGDLTLDGGGSADSIFIFQMASTLLVANGRQVVLIGGAAANNIWWQVGTSATVGTTAVFKGTIMADQSITVNAGAAIEGRLLARIASVALDSCAVTISAAPPAPGTQGVIANGVNDTFCLDACQASTPAVCGDGVCTAGAEDCASCPADCTVAPCGNGVCDLNLGENCINCPQDCNGKVKGKPGGRFCCGVDLFCGNAKCSGSEFECGTTGVASCCGDGVCESPMESKCRTVGLPLLWRHVATESTTTVMAK